MRTAVRVRRAECVRRAVRVRRALCVGLHLSAEVKLETMTAYNYSLY